MYVRQEEREITAHRRPYGEILARRARSAGVDLELMEPGDAPPVRGYRLAYVDPEGHWRLDGSNRIVAHKP